MRLCYALFSHARNAAEVVAYDALHQPLSPLFLDYLAGRAGASPFLGSGGFDLAAIAAAAQRSAAFERPMPAVAGALARQQEARGAPRAAERARALAEPGATAIVTGQQAGLFGGPLFVLWKALATIRVARQLEAQRGHPVVPVFWVASDDHDFAEIRSTSLIDSGGAIRTLRYTPRHEPAGQPAWAIPLDDTITALVEELGQALPPALGRDEALAVVAECYRPGVTLSEAFARFVSRLLPELVVLDPSDAELKRFMAPVMERELREGSPTSRLALEAGQALLAAGYHQQVPVRPGFLNLFALVEGQRRALGFAGGVVEVRGTRERWSVEEALRRLEADPVAWSPGALLRPLAQDALLPTAAYVGGPAEIAYHAQIAPSYAHFGIPRPALVPRPSLTLVEPAAGPGSRRRAAHPRGSRGRPRGARLALGPRGLSRRRGGVCADARGDRARDGGGRGGARGARPDVARGHGLGPGTSAPPDRGAPRKGAAGPQEARPGARRAPPADPRRPSPRGLAPGAGPRPRGRPRSSRR